MHESIARSESLSARAPYTLYYSENGPISGHRNTILAVNTLKTEAHASILLHARLPRSVCLLAQSIRSLSATFFAKELLTLFHKFVAILR